MTKGRATALVALIALAARAAIVAWAYRSIRPIADGEYYHVLGRRIAEGHGYTWLWPDGAVTYAAHYPVGYPALVALAYKVAGPEPGAAMVANALVGVLGAVAMHRALLLVTSERIAFVGAVVGFALNPALVSYTPALMTEGVSAALVAVMAWASLALDPSDLRPRRAAAPVAVLAVTSGFATLIRPQLLVLALIFPLLSLGVRAVRTRPRPRVGPTALRIGAAALLALAGALAVVAPWTARNCDKMGRCALVSLNGGWNLLIGTNPRANGTWAPVEVPEACLTVFDEAEKDACLGREGVRTILSSPGPWLAVAPKKLRATFDHIGAGPWYLHDSNAAVFSERARTIGGGLEEVFQRVLWALALVAATSRLVVLRPRAERLELLALAALTGLVAPGALTVLLFAVLALVAALRRRSAEDEGAAGLALAGGLVLVTALTHVVFFGAGRYALVILPGLVLAACLAAFPRSSAPAEGRG